LSPIADEQLSSLFPDSPLNTKPPTSIQLPSVL
jgi:hypothetical protein